MMQYVREIRVRQLGKKHDDGRATYKYATVAIKPEFRNIADYKVRGICVCANLDVAKDMIRRKHENNHTWVRFV